MSTHKYKESEKRCMDMLVDLLENRIREAAKDISAIAQNAGRSKGTLFDVRAFFRVRHINLLKLKLYAASIETESFLPQLIKPLRTPGPPIRMPSAAHTTGLFEDLPASVPPFLPPFPLLTTYMTVRSHTRLFKQISMFPNPEEIPMPKTLGATNTYTMKPAARFARMVKSYESHDSAPTNYHPDSSLAEAGSGSGLDEKLPADVLDAPLPKTHRALLEDATEAAESFKLLPLRQRPQPRPLGIEFDPTLFWSAQQGFFGPMPFLRRNCDQKLTLVRRACTVPKDARRVLDRYGVL
ncbi:hypothetical protein J8273_8798 [Carpediemonas membranifera]|uniref:Uncharacterized protein n=1 Tax=Carpediemonas membranifera TaxID=201153 RepID=A0A8J6ARE2_9EUKA|nr:hypothetical protein J8273_8798 [Carpediemonas membranifera]|eukprot:KAG9389505.1 hypothetical protein J8273_8798 [Carpediemonas membranifera]